MRSHKTISKRYQFVALRAQGKTPEQAVAEVWHDVSANRRAVVLKSLSEDPEIDQLIDLFLEAGSTNTDKIRTEIVAEFLRDSRDENLPIAARHKARETMIKIFGLGVEKVALSADDAFRDFLLSSPAKD